MSLTSPSRVTKLKSTPKRTHKTSPRPTTSPSTTPLISLETYVSNAPFDIVIQDQDDIAELSFERNFSPHVKETCVPFPLPLLHPPISSPLFSPFLHSPKLSRASADASPQQKQLPSPLLQSNPRPHLPTPLNHHKPATHHSLLRRGPYARKHRR